MRADKLPRPKSVQRFAADTAPESAHACGIYGKRLSGVPDSWYFMKTLPANSSVAHNTRLFVSIVSGDGGQYMNSKSVLPF